MVEVRKLTSWYMSFGAVTCLIGLIMTAELTLKNPYIAFPWHIATIMAFLFAVTGLIRCKSVKDPFTYGVIAIQHSWWIASVGLAGVLLGPADFFQKVASVESTVLTVFSAVWLFWGIYILYLLHKETKAPIAP